MGFNHFLLLGPVIRAEPRRSFPDVMSAIVNPLLPPQIGKTLFAQIPFSSNEGTSLNHIFFCSLSLFLSSLPLLPSSSSPSSPPPKIDPQIWFFATTTFEGPGLTALPWNFSEIPLSLRVPIEPHPDIQMYKNNLIYLVTRTRVYSSIIYWTSLSL